MSKIDGGSDMKADRVLEFNPDAPAYATLKKLHADGNNEKLEKYAKLFYGQALLLADLPLEDPAEFGALVSELMA